MKKLLILVLILLPFSIFADYGLKNGENVEIAVYGTRGVWDSDTENKNPEEEIIKLKGKTYTVEDVTKSGKNPINFIIDQVGAENILSIDFVSPIGMFITIVVYKV